MSRINDGMNMYCGKSCSLELNTVAGLLACLVYLLFRLYLNVEFLFRMNLLI